VRILFAAAENAALENGKVGGIGDVVGQLPPALAQRDCRVTVVVPSHGFLHRTAGAVRQHIVSFLFRGYLHHAEIYAVPALRPHSGVDQRVVHHAVLSALNPETGLYSIYLNDPDDRPFARDATRFAFFSKAVAAAMSQGIWEDVDCLHLHDWHAAGVAILRQFHSEHADLKKIHTVYTIHNLAFQGVRPLRGDESSLEAWFPEMQYALPQVSDPRWTNTVNPTAAAIRLSDVVHTVSPSYAQEIRQPSRKPVFYGGEGLEADITAVAGDGRLVGILNGCEYPDHPPARRPDFFEMLDRLRSWTIRWAGQSDPLTAAQFVAYARLTELGRRSAAPETLLTAVSRVGEQKMLLLREAGTDGKSGLKAVLEALGPEGCFIVLGSGDPVYEQFLTAMSSRYANFVFLNGYSDACARALFTGGDLFVMPSSFEPCGLSQMLAMREGQPCLVHAVGGLRDTVRNGENGFCFQGHTLEEQVDQLAGTLRAVLQIRRETPRRWRRICDNAAAVRFRWEDQIEAYLDQLYRPKGSRRAPIR